MLVPLMIANMAAGNVSIAYGLKGKSINVVTACATGTNSIGEAFRTIQYGDADVMIAGGTEGSVSPIGIAGFTALTALSGCRREDIREMTVSIPSLTEADKAKVVEALAKYNGVEKDSYKWDMNAKTLTLRYDSMQIAQANIRYAIDEKGVKVAFPAKTDNRAGH